jgi:putative ABC transport system permease protein
MTHILRHALRRVWQTRVLSAAAIVCIGVGAAATTTVATLISATLVRPVPFPAAERLVRLWFEEPGVNPRISFSIPDIADFQSLESFDAVIGTARVRTNARLGVGTERMRGEGVSRGYFEVLGVRPALGRVLAAGDHTADAPPVVVLSHGTWLRHFGGDPGIVGREFRTERTTYTIVGVSDRWFSGTVEDDIVEFFIPVEQYEPRALITTRASRPAWVVARLKPGATVNTASAEAAAVHAALIQAHPEIYRRWQVRVEPFGENWRQSLRAGGSLLFAAAVLLLVIAAINVGCLLLARALDRRRELALRAAIGAGRGRLVLELVAEAALLVAAGGALGMLAGPWVLDGFMAIAPPGHFTLPEYVRLEPDGTTFALTLALLGVAGLIAGTVPALLGRNIAPGEVLREGGRSSVGTRAEKRWGALLIASETALTLVLLVAGALLVRSYARLNSVDVGFDRDRILRLAVTLDPSDVGGNARLPEIYERLQRELSVVPGVGRVGLVHPTLPPYDGYRSRVRLEGMDLPQAPDGIEAGVHLANEGLLPMLGTPIAAGRDLRDSDGRDSVHVAVISRALATLLGGPDAAIGRTITLTARSAIMPAGSFRIVGVAENVAWDGLIEDDTRRLIPPRGDHRPSRYDVYVPLRQFPMTVVSIGVWTSGEPAALLDPLRRRLAQLAPASSVHWTGTMARDMEFEYGQSRFYAVLVAAFSWSALALTSIGLFGLLSQSAARRSAEMGLRIALGATPASAGRLLLKSGLAPLWAGITAGLILSLLTGRLMANQLYDIGGFDPGTVAIAVLVLTLVALGAGWIPARRVAAVDPTVVLRSD